MCKAGTRYYGCVDNCHRDFVIQCNWLLDKYRRGSAEADPSKHCPRPTYEGHHRVQWCRSETCCEAAVKLKIIEWGEVCAATNLTLTQRTYVAEMAAKREYDKHKYLERESYERKWPDARRSFHLRSFRNLQRDVLPILKARFRNFKFSENLESPWPQLPEASSS